MCMMHGMDHSQRNAQGTTASAPPQNESLLDILKRRYALGEITVTQFEEMRRVLGLTLEVPRVEMVKPRHH